MAVPVFFEQALNHIPANAITIEVGPDTALSTIVAMLRPTGVSIKLMSRTSPVLRPYPIRWCSVLTRFVYFSHQRRYSVLTRSYLVHTLFLKYPIQYPRTPI
jgi:hypothetical protein